MTLFRFLLPFLLSFPALAAITLTTTSVPAAQQGIAYNAQLQAIGGNAPYGFQVLSGLVPPGLILTPSGQISGTPTTAGSFRFTVRMTDSSSPNQTGDSELVIVVNSPANLQITTASLPTGQVGQGYNTSLSATGGAGNYIWDLVSGQGNLPNGLTIASNGTILGTPNLAGSFSFVVRVTDSNGLGNVALANFTIVVNSNVLTIQNTSLPNASVGAFYSQPITVTGGQQPYTISIISGTLPPGLSFSNAGVISGTPSAIGSTTFTVRVTDGFGGQATQTLTLTVTAPVFALNQTPLPTGQVGTAYSGSVTAVGGTQPYTFIILNGVLPSGISFNNGVFSGTPTVSGSFPLTIRVTDAVSNSAQGLFTLVINSSTLVITNQSLPNAVLNQSYSTSLIASGGQSPYTFTLVGGLLPQGLSLAANGTISGTPTQTGDFPFTVRVTDFSGALTQQVFNLTVSLSSLVLNTTALQNGAVNQPYTGNLSATGGTSPYSYSVVGGALPQGLTLGANGLVSGTPTLAGTYQVTFRVQDAVGATAQSTVSIVIASQSGFRIETTFLASARLGQPYTANVVAAGGTTPYLYFLVGGQLPPGLVFATSGIITGTPSQQGNFAFTVRAVDNGGQIAEANLAISVNNNNLSLTNAQLPAGQLNVAYSATLTASGGTPPYNFVAIAGGLPPGLLLSVGGTLSGTPVASGNYPFAVQVTDNTQAIAVFNVSVQISGTALSITTASLPNGTVGSSYSASLAASGGVSPYSFTINGGSLPGGLNLAATGAISGTPTTNGTFAFTVRVTDNSGATATRDFQITVGGTGTLSITTASLPSAPLGQPYTAPIQVTGGVTPYTYSIIGGSLPPGLSLLNNGVISGTPTQAGTYSFILRVTDNFGSATQQSLQILVSLGGVVITTTSLPNGQLGQFYNTTLTATNGQAPYAWTVISGQLPAGVTLNSNGTLSGLPTTGGGFEVTIRVVDSTGQFTTRTFTFVIGSTVLGFLTTSLPQGFINQPYNFQLQVGGGAAPYLFTIVSGALPPGLTMSNLGQITGTPTQTVFNTITFRVTDATSATADRTLNLAVGQSTLQISTLSVPNAAIGQSYNTALLATGGTPPYTFSLESGQLPAGLQLSAAGVIAGTATTPGIATFTIRVTDGAGALALQTFTINVLASSLTITTTSLPNGRVNQPYLQTIQTSGGVLPIRFEIVATIVAGQPPPGLTLSLQGVLQGTPQTTGTFTFTVRATDAQNLVAQANFTITIQQAAPVISTASLPGGTAGQVYSQGITATGGTPPYAFTVASGGVPGLSLSTAGILSGTPNTPGTYSISVRVTDAVSQSTESTFSITIAAGAAPLSIPGLAPPPGTLYFPYNFVLSATGGRSPYSWSIPVGPIPNGLRLEPTGALNGLLLAPGTYRFTARVTDANGASADTQITINVAGASRLEAGRVGSPYTGQVPNPATGRAPFTFAVNNNALGRLPEGLTLGTDGRLTGTPLHAGEYTLGLLVRDAGGVAQNQAISLSILPGTGLRILTQSLPGGATGTPYSQTFQAAGGTPPYNWVLQSGTLPNGLNLNPLSGVLSGTPTLQGNNFFLVRVADSSGASAISYYGISVGSAGSPVINAITSAASYGAEGIVPGELLTIFGGTLGPPDLVSFTLVNNEVPALLSGMRVLFDGIPAPILYTQAGQASVIAPFRLENQPSTRVVIEYLGFQSTPFTLPVIASKPALFTVDSSGSGPGAILNQNGSVNTATNRAGRESIVVLYMTGAGAMTPAGLEGRVAAGVSQLNQPISVTINGSPASILYAGNAPGLVEGVVQVNVRLPFNTLSGANPISVRVGQNSTTTNVTVFVD